MVKLYLAEIRRMCESACSTQVLLRLCEPVITEQLRSARPVPGIQLHDPTNEIPVLRGNFSLCCIPEWLQTVPGTAAHDVS